MTRLFQFVGWLLRPFTHRRVSFSSRDEAIVISGWVPRWPPARGR